MNQNSQLRKILRNKRRALSIFKQRTIEQRCFFKLTKHKNLIKAKKVGVYLDAFGEVRTRQLIEYCFKHHKAVFLPMICNMNKKLVWVRISRHQYINKRFSFHSLGMKEPMKSRACDVSTLDILVMPLLACDLYGTRLGMGGGFYDRTLATARRQPHRLGLAHDFQVLDEKLIPQPWDQSLDSLITPSKNYHFKR